MQTNYKTELGKSYMILAGGQREDMFSVQMLTENHIRGLLPFEKRSFNGEIQFFYDVTGMCSLASRVQKIPLGEKDIRRLFQELYCVFEEIYSYFLKTEGLMLQADYIFETQERVFFCYCPSEEIERSGFTIETFAEELLDQIDNEEEEALQLAYRFYALVKDAKKGILFILEEVLTEKNCLLESTEPQEQISVDEICVCAEREDAPAEKQRIKKTGPDVYTVGFFLLSFLVSLCYLFVVPFSSTRNVQMVPIAVFMAISSIVGMAAGFIDIDIVRKK